MKDRGIPITGTRAGIGRSTVLAAAKAGCGSVVSGHNSQIGAASFATSQIINLNGGRMAG